MRKTIDDNVDQRASLHEANDGHRTDHNRTMGNALK